MSYLYGTSPESYDLTSNPNGELQITGLESGVYENIVIMDSLNGCLASLPVLKGFFYGMESRYNFRRTTCPILYVVFGHQNNGEVPVRFRYFVNVQSLNKFNYESSVSILGEDGLNITCWWEKK